MSWIWLPPGREVGRTISTHGIPLGRDPFLCFQELDIHCMETSCCDLQIGGDVQPKSVNDDQKKGAIPTEGAEPVKRSGPKLVIRIDLERAGNGRRRASGCVTREFLRQKGQIRGFNS